ncbi:hypothetical protein [Streptomyces sp. NPDC006610]|uniref:hypothetical protein n=1 Tax=Streptomyces sp. NPDC006610 TaxID=3154584 RepID=UPI0033BD8CF5
MRWGRRRAATRPSGTGRTPRDTGPAGPGFVVEEYDRLLLLRRSSDELLGPADIADLTRVLEADTDDTVTVVAGADEDSAAALWPRLGALLDTLRGDGVGTVRLAMSGAGDGRSGRIPVAGRIADAWDIDVIAPDGTVLGVPGGGLFVHDAATATAPATAATALGAPASGRERGWWRFAPGGPPTPLGPRQPAPAWQPPPGGLPARTRNGCVVEQIPAGVLIRPADARAPRPGDLCYAVPVDRRGPLVVLGVPDGEDIVTDDVADVVAALPAAARTALRFAPGGRRDVLRVGQGAADLVDAEVVVYSGLPLLAESGTRERDTVRSMTVAADGTPSWQPFVDSVICAPGADRPRLLRWSPPLPGPGDALRGVIRLSDRWQVAATRAGLWVGGTDAEPPALAARPVDTRGPDIEVGRPGESLDRSLWPELERLLASLPPGVTARARLHVHGTAVDGGRELRRIAARFELRSLRFATFGRPANGEGAPAAGSGPAPASAPAPAPRPVSTATASPASSSGSAATSGPAPVGTTPSVRTASSAGASAAAATSVPSGAASPAVPPEAPARTESPGPSEHREHGERAPRLPAASALSGPEPQEAGADVGGKGAPDGASRTAAAAVLSELRAEEAAAGAPPTAAGPGASAARPTPAGRTEPARTPSRPAPATPAAPERTPSASGGPNPRTGPASSATSAPADPEQTPSASGGPNPRTGHASSPAPTPLSPAVPQQTPPAPDAANARSTPSPSPTPTTEGPSPSAEPDQPADPPLPGPPTRPALTSTGTAPAPPPRTATPMQAASTPAPPPRTAAPTQAPSTSAPKPRTEAPAQPPHTPEPPPRTAADGQAPQTPQPPAPLARPLPPVPFLPGHQSTQAERAAFRALADSVWDRQAAAVTRTFTRMPALRGQEQEAARADLIALLLYLRSPDGTLGHEELDRCLRAGDPRLLPYAACVASALRRLPSFRGAVLRGPGPGTPATPAPGTVLRDPAPVSALPGDGRGPSFASARYAIWSVTGRRVRQLFDATGPSAPHDEVVFAPGTAFRVLDVRNEGPSPLVLLRELPADPAAAPLGHAEPDDRDRAVLARLDEAPARHPGGGAVFDWPDRCAGPLGSAEH